MISLLAAFSSGVIGAALGGVLSIILTALAALAGIGANIAGAHYNIVDQIAFGMFLGPHVSFGPACCAAAYAAKRGYLSHSHDVTTPLASLHKADVLLTGGGFAVAGWLLNMLLQISFANKIDTIAVSVLMISLAAKRIFGGSLIGKPEEGKSRFGKNSRCWLPWQNRFQGWYLWVLGSFGGLISGYITWQMCEIGKMTGNEALIAASVLPVWGFALIAFFFLAMEKQIPIINHIGICAGYAARMVFLCNGSRGDALLWAIAFGVLSGYAGDFLAQVFDVNGPGYVDPPSIVVALLSAFPMSIFPMLDKKWKMGWKMNIIPILVILLLILAAAYYHKKHE